MSTSFADNLAFGKIAESKIVRWILRNGSAVLPVYDIKGMQNKGPRLLTESRNGLVAPDLLVIAPDKSFSWIEAKHKSAFSWYRRTESWVTGIDLHHYSQYLKIRERTGVPVYVLFLHASATPSQSDLRHGCPPSSPVGLFGDELGRLEYTFSHTSPNHGSHGMIYWDAEVLVRYATIEEVEHGETP